MRTGRPLAASALVLLATITAGAEPVPSLDLRNFHPPADPHGSLYLEPAKTPGSGEWNAGAWLSYSYGSVTLEDGSGTRVAMPVKHQLSLDYVAAVGVLDRLAVSLTLPTVLYQNAEPCELDSSDSRCTTAESALGSSPLPQTALGDAAFGLKASIIPTDELGGFGLAALARVTAPTGDSRSYVSDGTVTGELRLLAELRLIAIALQGTAGARVRGHERTFVGEQFGHDLPWGVGLSVRPQAFGLDDKGRWTWTAEMRGQVAITPELASGPQSPILGGLSARYTVGDVSAIAGAEMPINDAVGSPVVRGVLGVSWAPRFYDEDGDGVADDVDECPELAEDKDGFEDSDGCPDFDNDDDGVPDEEDRCPTEQEDEDDFQDDDGCIDPDDDGDGIPDTEDACKDEAGPATGSVRGPGCPVKDADGDGIDDSVDKCPDAPEDKDGFKDDDGCPDPDNDGDGVLDEEDACPTVKGQARSDAKLNGCPNPDSDGDTWDDAVDKCPKAPEDFDGVDDEDGCPDDDSAKPAPLRAKPLVTLTTKGDQHGVKWRVAPKLVSHDGQVDVDPATLPSVRALASLLNANPAIVALVGVKPANGKPEAEQDALNKSFALVNALRTLTHRDEVSETISWAAVQGEPDATRLGYGILLLGATTPPPTTTPKPAIAAPPKAPKAPPTPK